MKRTTVSRALVLGITATLVAAACSDDSGSTKAAVTTAATTAAPASGSATTASGATATAAPAAHGPFKVMVIGDFTSVIAYTVEESVPAVKGVLNDVPGLTVESCDSKGDANAASACQRKAVSDGVVAVINSFGYAGQNQAILSAAGIPTLDQAAESQPLSFSMASSVGGYVGIGIALGNAGCKKLGVLMLDGTDVLADAITHGIASVGGAEVARAAIPATAPDLSPAIAKLTGAGAECIALSITPPQIVQAVTAIGQTGKKPLVGGTGAIFFPQIISALGSKADGIITVEMAAGAADPAAAPAKAAQASADPKAKFSSQSVYAWMSAVALKAAIANVQGPVTAKALTAALNGLKNVDMQNVGHNFSAEENANPAYKRWMNHYSIAYVLKGGVPTRSGDFFDVGPALASLKPPKG